MADSILKIRTQDGDKPIGYPGLADKPVANKELDTEGAFADAKVVGDKFKEVKAETDSLKEDLCDQKAVKIQYLSDRTDWNQDKYWSPSLVETSGNGYMCTRLDAVRAGTYSIIGISPDFSFVIPKNGEPKSLKAIFGSFSMIKPKTITLEECDLLITSINTAPICMMCDGSSIPSSYVLGIFDFVEKLQERIKKISEKENVKITVGASANADFSKLDEAIKSISDSGIDKIYDIMLEDGIYNILMDMTASDGFLPDYVNIIGMSGDKDKVIIVGENEENSNSDKIINCSTINIKRNNNIENVTITARNCRYAVHSESSGAVKKWTQKIKNCKFVHYGNAGNANNVWVSCHAWGEGASSGAFAEFENVEFKAPYYPAYIHEPPTEDGIIPYHHIFKKCKFTNTVNAISASSVAMEIDNTRNNNCVHRVDFVDCNFGGGMLSIMGNYDIDVTVHGCNDVLIRRGDNTTKNNYYKNFPTTERSTIKRYVGNSALKGGEILAYSENSNNCILATPTTPKELIAGIFNGTAKKNDFVNLNQGLFYLSDFSFGKSLYVGDDGKISENGTIAIAFGFGRYAKFFN